MKNGFTQFRGTVGIHAAMIRLTLGADHVSTTNRATFRHVKRLCPPRMLLVVDDRNDFRNYIAASLHLYPVANLHPETLDLIHVVQGGARHGRATNRNRTQCGDWR